MYRKCGKRVLDLALSIIGAVVLFVPMIFVALAIKLDSQGPVFFRQPRYGKDKKPFTVYKFRTMSTNAPADVPTNSFKDAGIYITRLGRVMRKLSIDELPQIINVLRGEMSIVGPRPVVLKEKKLLQERAKNNALSFKPGITGWAQVNGRDELDDVIKAQFDGHYAENFGLAIDVKCIAKTFLVIFTASGHAEGHEQQEEDRQFEAASE